MPCIQIYFFRTLHSNSSLPNRRFDSIKIFRIFRFPATLVSVLACGASLSAQMSLGLSSVTANPGSSVNLQVSLSGSGNAPAALQWTLSYAAGQISAVGVTAGAASTQAGKNIQCAPATGSLTCLVTGLNTTGVAAGVVANIQLMLAPDAATTSLGLMNPVAVGATGSALSLSATGGVVTVPAVSSVVCSPGTLGAGGTSTCTAAISQPAPAGGTPVTLASNNALLTVPASVTVSQGASTATFSATASSSIGASQTATISAALAGGSVQALIGLTGSGQGSPLSGSQITGSATLPPSAVNQFDPSVRAEPGYCGNTAGTTVTMNNPAPGGVEFQFCAVFASAGAGPGAAPANAIVVQFNGPNSQFPGSTLTIQVSLGSQPSWTPFQLTFSDSAFAGLQLVKYADNFLCAAAAACGVRASLNGNIMSVSGGVPAAGGVYNAAFTLTTPGSTLSLIAPPWNAALLPYPTVAWNPVAGAQLYDVWAGGAGGTAAYGPQSAYNSWPISATGSSLTLPLVPMPSTGGITLWDEVNGNWNEVSTQWLSATVNLLGSSALDPAYQGSVGWESLIYPLNGATNVDPFKPFTWLGGGNSDGSNLTVGTSPGASDVFNSGTIQDTRTIPPAISGGTLPVSGLRPNTTYYARLSGPPGFNTPTDVSFTTGVGRAHLIYPADYAQQLSVANPVVFACNSVQGALQYVLWLGSTPGGSDVMVGWPGLAATATITLYPNHIYYARMWTQQAGGTWLYVDSRFSTYTSAVAFVSFPANGELHATANPRQYFPGSAASAVDIGWQLVPGATGYTLWVGTYPGGNDATDTYSYTVAGNVGFATASLSTQNSTYYLRLWTQAGSNWYYTDSVVSTYQQNPTSHYGDYAQ
jgi:hypothetical protein